MFAVAVALVAVSQVAVAVTDRDLDILAAYVKLKPNAFFFALLRSLSSVPVLYLACLQLACPDARTLNSHLQETEAPIAMYPYFPMVLSLYLSVFRHIISFFMSFFRSFFISGCSAFLLDPYGDRNNYECVD